MLADVWLMWWVQTRKQLRWPQSAAGTWRRDATFLLQLLQLWSQKSSAFGPPQKLCFLTDVMSQSVWLSEGLTHHVISHSAKQMQSELFSPKTPQVSAFLWEEMFNHICESPLWFCWHVELGYCNCFSSHYVISVWTSGLLLPCCTVTNFIE